MAATILDGKAIARAIRNQAARDIQSLDRAPGLGVILVGDDPASHLYVSLKEKACAEAGIRFEKQLFDARAAETEVLAAVDALNRRSDIDAILVQLPLPAQIDEDRVIAAIDPAKDVDGFHPANVAALESASSRIVPGLAASIMALIDAAVAESGTAAAEAALAGKSALVIGNSDAFYAPLKTVLSRAGAAPAFARPDDADIAQQAQAADIVVVAVGRAGFLKGDMVKPGAIIIDVGTNKSGAKTVGDVDTDSVSPIAGALSPVPGGVGPVTVAMLIKNTVALASQKT